MILEQYSKFKQTHPDAVLLFRTGNFYNMYEDDAQWGADNLGLAMTKRDGVRLAAFPYHGLDFYLPKIVRAGMRVAIFDQLEEVYKKETGVKRHTLSRREITALYKEFENFIADCTPEEIYEFMDGIRAVQTLLHRREQESK